MAEHGVLPSVRDRAGVAMLRFVTYAIVVALLLYAAAAAALYLFQGYRFIATAKSNSSPAQAGLLEAAADMDISGSRATHDQASPKRFRAEW